jgi:hypothetical protein
MPIKTMKTIKNPSLIKDITIEKSSIGGSKLDQQKTLKGVSK